MKMMTGYACQLLERISVWTQDLCVVCDQYCVAVVEIPCCVAFLMVTVTVYQKQLNCADYHEMCAFDESLYVERVIYVEQKVKDVVCVKTLHVVQMKHLALLSVADCCSTDVSVCLLEGWHDAVEKVVVCEVTGTSCIDAHIQTHNSNCL